MTPGAGTAHVVGRVACRWMRAGRRLNVVSRWLVCGVARRGAIHDARCRNGTCGRPRCVSVDAGGATVDCCFAVVVLWFFRRPVCGTASVIRASQVAPLRLRRLIVVSRRLVCGVARGGAIHDARCRNGTCGRPRCVSADAGGAAVGLRHRVGHPGVTSGAPTFAAVECCFAAVIRASRVAPLRLRVVECCFAAVIRASQVAPLRLRVVVGGVTRGCRGKGMGMKKRSRTDVVVSVWLLVVAEARLERTTSRL